ncbi:hypothetical protein [Sporosarcina sp. SAFN-010]|uniref:hypothetical protein n=1 Tax=Sporosarcina sp. SAFN-010 TaxID=3387273 RepID=UPI003F7D96A0
MKNYLKLVNFEFNRIAKLFAVLLGVTFVIQIVGVIVQSRYYLNMANELIYEGMLSKAKFLENYGHLSLSQIVNSMWFRAPILFCVAAVGFYIFLIWYRDWVGKNSFIYRLLMLPTARLNIFFAKITTILIMTLGLVAFQLIMLPIETLVMKGIVPKEFIMDISLNQIMTSLPELRFIFPNRPIELILMYGAGVLAVSILFTAILMERSFKWKGIIAGLIYSSVAVGLTILPLLLNVFVLNGFFYSIELFVLEIIMASLVLTGSIWTCRFLLMKKITV